MFEDEDEEDLEDEDDEDDDYEHDIAEESKDQASEAPIAGILPNEGASAGLGLPVIKDLKNYLKFDEKLLFS